MAILIYNIITIASIPFLLPFFLYRLLFDSSYRKGTGNRLGVLPEEIKNGVDDGNRRYWFHAVSVGEVMAAAPLVKIFKDRHPASIIIFSTVTDTGNRTARGQIPEIDHLIYFPFDLFWIVRRVVMAMRPRLFIFFETEIWPNLLLHLKSEGIPSVMINGRISDRSFGRYKLVRKALKGVLGSVALFLMQTEKDREKIVALGANPYKVFNTGNTKYDRALELIMREKGCGLTRADLNIPDGSVVLVAGSTHQGEEEILIDVFQRILAGYPDAVMIIAPRHLDRLGKIEALMAGSGLSYMKRSCFGEAQQGQVKIIPPHPSLVKGGREDFQVIILDTIGELSDLYKISTIAFVGGSLVPVGGHNILEPAAHGRPVIFGPYMDNFHEIATLIAGRGGAVQAQDRDDLYMKIDKLLSDRDSLERTGREAKRFVMENSGATEKNMKLIERYIN
ncbi:MAG: 3-deoxy-D-manno-octulosonic acid transferase [Nitrospirota bacterium]|mgnify:CR=1 FL=1